MTALISASGSCGSSLLAQLLDNHPEIACGAELGLFSKPIFYDRYELLLKHAALIRKFGVSSRPFFEDRSVLRNLAQYSLDSDLVWAMVMASDSIASFSASLEKRILSLTGKKIWVEKSPENIYLTGRILKYLPDTKIIHLHRDPRDVVLSFLKRGHSAVSGSEVWLTSAASVEPYDTHPNLIEISYRNLVTDTHSVLRNICTFLDVEWKAEYFFERPSPSRGFQRQAGFTTWDLSPSSGVSDKKLDVYKTTGIDLQIMNNMALDGRFANMINARPWRLRDLAEKYGYFFDWPAPKASPVHEASRPVLKNAHEYPFNLYEPQEFVNRVLI